ncbi:MAG: hypothetical protein JNK41_13040 [Saprospiraceae bacterium]|nr:hypothetical protein [Saprospiraceae bacterium]
MLSILRTNQLVANVIFVIYMLALKLPYMLHHECEIPAVNAGIFNVALSGLLPANKYWVLVIQIVLVVAQATILNTLVNKFRMMRDANLFPGFVWVIVVNLFPDYLCNTSLLFADLFILLSVRELFAVYKKNEVSGGIFNIGFYLALSSFFYPGFLLFIIPVILGLQILRAPRFNEYVILFSGILSPIIIMSSLYYWNDELILLKSFQLDVFALNFTMKSINNGIYKMCFIVFLILVCLIRYPKVIFKQSIQNIKYIEILYFFMLTGGVMTFFIPDRGIEQFLSIILPISILGGLILFSIPQKWAEMIHLLLIFAVYFWQFAPSFKI